MNPSYRGRPRAFALTALLIAALAAIAIPSTAPAAKPSKGPRVVALSPFTANVLVGLGVQPIGIGQTLGGHERLSRKLRGARKLPLSHPNGPNMEQLTQLRPKLVFSSATWRKGGATMRNLGMRVVESDPQSVFAVPSETRRIGRILGKRARAEAVAKRQQRRIAAARKGITKRPKVLLLLGVGRTPFAFLPNSWGGDLVAKAGGRLLTAGLTANGGFARISDEVVLKENPDVIIAVPHANEDDIPGIRDYIRDNQVWKLTKAGKNGRIHISTNNSLLQAGTDVDRVIRQVRARYLKN